MGHFVKMKHIYKTPSAWFKSLLLWGADARWNASASMLEDSALNPRRVSTTCFISYLFLERVRWRRYRYEQIWRIMGLTCTTYRLSTFSISGHRRVQRIFKSLMNASTRMVCKKEFWFFLIVIVYILNKTICSCFNDDKYV